MKVRVLPAEWWMLEQHFRDDYSERTKPYFTAQQMCEYVTADRELRRGDAAMQAQAVQP